MQPNWRKDVLTVKEASMMLHVSISTVRRMIRDNILHASSMKMGVGRGTTVVPREEIEHYIESLKSAARRSISA